MNTEKLKMIINKFNIEKRAIEAFWSFIKKDKEQDPEEFEYYLKGVEIEKLSVKIKYIEYKLENWPECNYNHIEVYIPVWYENKHIGDFSTLYNIDDGELYDIYFSTF